MRLPNLRLGARLGTAFGLLAAVVMGIAVLSLTALGRADTDFQQFIHGINHRAALASRLRAAFDTRAISARNLVLVTKKDEMEVEKALVQRAHADVQETLGLLKEAARQEGVSARARQLIAEIDKVEQAYGPVALGIAADAIEGRREAAISAMNDKCRPLLAQLVKATDDYAAFSAGVAAERVAASNEHYERQRSLMIAAGIGAVALALVVAFVVTRSITRPLGEALALAEAVATGDLTVRAAAEGRDEVSRLLAALGEMSAGLEGIVRQVRGSSESIATGSAEIATGNLDLSQRTEQQASALQQTAATMEQLTQTFRHNADNARQANQLATGARDIAQRGGGVVGEAVETMRAINHSSKKISEITGVIDAIAFQTNILALNAAVEAARAGEQGRGFAVVAGEVRGLAKRSAEAAREIKSLIQASVEQVERGTQQVDAAGASMGEIVDAFRRVGELVAAISSASAEQSQSASQVGDAVSQLDQVTQQNAALVEESAAASESLKGQADALQKVVATFRVNA